MIMTTQLSGQQKVKIVTKSKHKRLIHQRQERKNRPKTTHISVKYPIKDKVGINFPRRSWRLH